MRGRVEENDRHGPCTAWSPPLGQEESHEGRAGVCLVLRRIPGA